MPAAVPPEPSVTGPVPAGEGGEIPDPNMHGIAQRVSDARAEAGLIEPVQPGVGITMPAGLERGREMLANGADPYEILRNFGDTGRMSSDDFAVLRAQSEALAKAASDAANQDGINSDEYRGARAAESDFI